MNLKDIHKQIMSELGSGPEYKGSNGITVPSVVAKEEVAKQVGTAIGQEDARKIKGSAYEQILSQINSGASPEDLIKNFGNMGDVKSYQDIKSKDLAKQLREREKISGVIDMVTMLNALKQIQLGDEGLSAPFQGIKNWGHDILNTKEGTPIELYEAKKQAAGSKLAREGGEKGTLTDQDILRFLSGLPEVTGFGADPKSVYQQKIVPEIIKLQIKYPEMKFLQKYLDEMPGSQDILKTYQGIQ
ncbi:MAG: hypothetical protein QG556_379 [Pseudomonadota bacterium]|nr:hypothetical protein [Pseudomonadota bacterium]